VQQAESSAVVISLQGLCTTTFQLLKRELANRYENRVVFHFSPHSCPQEHWQAHYESDSAICDGTAARNMYGSMVIYLSPREGRDFLLTSKEIVCAS
jgi:hypothetical protein